MAEQLRFPRGFVWGAATASFQVEGGREERGDSIWDDFCRWTGKVYLGETGDIADDQYHLYPRDIELMAQLGVGAYRFSVSWPRVQPDGVGRINPIGLDFYDRLVDGLLEKQIDPYVTLYHWDLPSALQRVGGWAARDCAYRFADYAQIVAERLGDRVRNWITHNEPWVVAFVGHEMGRHAPGWEDMGMALQVAHHTLLSHGLAVPILRENSLESQVGITISYAPSYPASSSAEDLAAARHHDGYQNRWFTDAVFTGKYPQDTWDYFGYLVPRVAPGDMEIISRPIDFLGVNYYSRALVQAAPDGSAPFRQVHPEGKYTAMGWEVYPQGLTDLLVRLWKDYQPGKMYITENGCAYEDTLTSQGKIDDPDRVEYYRLHLAAAHAAIQQGVPLKGYFAWSLLDNFEWALGYSRRFGLVYVDFATQQRYPKASAEYYRSVIAANAV